MKLTKTQYTVISTLRPEFVQARAKHLHASHPEWSSKKCLRVAKTLHHTFTNKHEAQRFAAQSSPNVLSTQIVWEEIPDANGLEITTSTAISPPAAHIPLGSEADHKLMESEGFHYNEKHGRFDP